MSANTIDVVVEEIKKESPQVKSFKLKPAETSRLLRCGAGSHVKTYVQVDQDLFENSYSLINDPNESGYYQIAIRRSDESKGGSVCWHERVKEGDQLKISYPKNHFSLSFGAKHHILIAAGIGITPFIAMAADLKRKGKSFELHYAARSNDLCAFQSFLNSYYPDETRFYFSEQGNRMNTDLMDNQPIGTHVYFCGPEKMINEYAEAAKSYGYPDSNIHFELFAQPDFGPMEPFQVKLNRSNKTIEIPEGESMLDILLKHGIDAPYSCKVGGCGSCLVDVLEGEVDHRDLFLTDKEKQEESVICTCVSRAKTKNGSIVLDL